MKRKNLLQFSIIVLLFIACNGIEKKKVSLSSQNTDIMIDSIICGINFNDSPERVQTKIKEWASHNTLGEFEYRFIYPQQLNKYAWNYYPRGCWFHNDSLYCFQLSAEIPSYQWEECFADLDTLYSYKYGTPIRNKESYKIEWQKGNLKIEIEGFKNAINEYIWITYCDYRYYRNKRSKVKSKLLVPEQNRYGAYLSYDIDYWNKIYQKADDILKNEASKGI